MSAESAPDRATEGFITINGQEIYHKQHRPRKKTDTGVVVVLLHGARFSSQNWEDIGTLKHLAREGFGRSKEAKADDRSDFLKSVVDSVEGDVKVLVSPSMSGSYSVPYVNAYGDEIDGYVPVAPVSVSSLSPPKKVKKKLHVFAVAGSKDRGGVSDLPVFEKTFENYGQLIIEDAGHPAYLDNPDLFNTELSSFAISLK